MTASIVLTSVDQRGAATVTLNRPEVHNAYNGALIDALSAAVAALAADPRVRLLVLRANGKHFQAGADLAWLREVAGRPLDDNVAFSRRTTLALLALNAFPRPTLALVHGACFGGGVGMVASCDVAIATGSASFALTEVRWGVIPAPIIPQLCAALGVRNLRRYGVTGERFDAPEAKRIGLVHEVCPDDALDRAAAPIIDAILKSAPDAVRASKGLVLAQAGLDLTEQQVEALALQAAVKRASAEAADGLASFLDKRDPPWYPPARDREATS
ncbi:MAG: enoyl-CoA hydratase-related protein [Geminicoccaceae bacterium]